MKTVCSLLIWAIILCFFSACDKSEISGDDLSSNNLKSGKTVTVTLPFEAYFTGEYMYVGPGETCKDPQFLQVIVDFKGTATHLGKITGNFDFCCDAESNYGPTTSFMLAANGDKLFVSCAGRVIDGRLDDHPEYVTSYWRDPFVITGGTGRFEGATGSGITDDYNSSLDPNSHHHWKGEITLLKGKR